jgi:hypothetical protein
MMEKVVFLLVAVKEKLFFTNCMKYATRVKVKKNWNKHKYGKKNS